MPRERIIWLNSIPERQHTNKNNNVDWHISYILYNRALIYHNTFNCFLMIKKSINYQTEQQPSNQSINQDEIKIEIQTSVLLLA